MKSKTLFEIDKSISDIAQLSAEAFPPEHIKSIEAKACDPTEGPALWAADGSEKLILLRILSKFAESFILRRAYPERISLESPAAISCRLQPYDDII